MESLSTHGEVKWIQETPCQGYPRRVTSIICSFNSCLEVTFLYFPGQEKGQENSHPGSGEQKHILHHVRFPCTCHCHELSNIRTHCCPSYCGNAARARTKAPDTCAANCSTPGLLLDTCNVLAAWAAFRSPLSLLKAAYILYEQDKDDFIFPSPLCSYSWRWLCQGS